ncbi:MAG: hypothetical protein A3J76_03790 [Candidatus Moranbacteria bacterium RBG_13_45_13]|nr:MAG: hypothetical protein A3J76_03790 [Candidatus Moranbacteria bacterium RBG_13_45_13]
MNKILLKATLISVLIIPFLFSGCGKKQVVTEKVPEQTTQQETNNNVALPQNTTAPENQKVSLSQGEDVARLFFSLINEGKIPDAVAMLDASVVPNDSAKQAWGVQFNVFDSIAIKSVEPSSVGDEIENQKTYKVVLDAKIKPGSENAPIPNYGWENGENIRWVSLKKNSEGMWKILGIRTGP